MNYTEFSERMRIANDYANSNGFSAGFPNCHQAEYQRKVFMGYEHYTLCGTILLKAGNWVVWRDVRAVDLGNPATEDIAARFRATNDYAGRNGFAGGFPNFHQADYGNGVVYGTILLRADIAEWRDVSAADLGNPDPTDIRARFTATHDYANRNGFAGGFPNFHEADYGSGVVYGTILLRSTGAEWRDVPGDIYGISTRFEQTGRSVAGFLPSTSSFHFRNSFPTVPHLTINVVGQQIPIGDASNGLCGGMVFAVRDYFEAGMQIPLDTTAPSSGPLFDYLVKRLYDSFDLILPPPPPPPPFITPIPPWGPGPSTYMWLMNPALPDHETWASNLALAPRGRAWVMINDEWPKIKADIDSNRLSPLALIHTKSPNPLDMKDNHQVLAYAYEQSGSELTIYVYDPNRRSSDTDTDNITLSLSIKDPQHTTMATYSLGGQVWCFFRPAYTFSQPT